MLLWELSLSLWAFKFLQSCPLPGSDQVLDTQLGDFGWGVHKLLEELALHSSCPASL